MNAKAGEYRCSELRSLDVTISARYHWSVARQLTPFHYVIGISGILPYNRNVTLQTLQLFSAYARLYNAAASPASRLRSAACSAASLAIRLFALDFYEVMVDEAESQINHYRIEIEMNNLIVLLQFLLRFTSNNSFQLLLDVLLNFAPSKDRPD